MNKKRLGILSFAPLSLLIASFALLLVGSLIGINSFIGIVTIGITAIIGVISASVLIYITMMYLLSWACRQSFFSCEDLQTWALLFYFLNIFIYPIFWWMYIRSWRENDEVGYIERTVMSKEDAKAYAFLPLDGLGIMFFLLVIGLVLEKILPVAGVIIGMLLFFLFVAYGIYVIYLEAKFFVEVAKSSSLTMLKKVMWAFFFIMYAVIALPVYWCIHMRNENGDLSRQERASIRKRNREFTRNRKNEQYKRKLDELFQGRMFTIFSILPVLCLLSTIVLTVCFDYSNEVSYLILKWICFFLIGSGVVEWGLYTASLWLDIRHNVKDKILWTISMTAFTILLFPIYWDKYLRNKSKIQEEKQRKHLVIVSGLPLVLFVIFMMLGITNAEVIYDFVVFEVVFILATLFLPICYLFSFLVFSVKVLDNTQLSAVKKVCWIVALLLLGGIAAPFYWWKHIFSENREENV